MKLVLAKNYLVGSKLTSAQFVAEFTYGLRAGQGLPMTGPDGLLITARANAAFEAGKAWGRANPASRDVWEAQAALNTAWRKYR